MQPSAEVHHAAYQTPLLGRVCDNELAHAGIALFPVCLSCHQVLHQKEHWSYGDDPVWDAANSPVMLSRLRANYKRLTKAYA